MEGNQESDSRGLGEPTASGNVKDPGSGKGIGPLNKISLNFHMLS